MKSPRVISDPEILGGTPVLFPGSGRHIRQFVCPSACVERVVCVGQMAGDVEWDPSSQPGHSAELKWNQ